MNKWIFYFLLLFSSSMFSQESIKVELLQKNEVEEASIISIDNFNTVYSLKNNTLFKFTEKDTLNYSNIQLGDVESVNLFNPLKINLFYKDFNTVIILDNRLAEIFKIDFNSNSNYKNAAYISTGSDNTIWVYNQETQQLELFDYKANKTRLTTIPMQSRVLALISNYNYCWLLTENYLYQFNYFGSLVYKIKNDRFSKMAENNGSLILQKENMLYYLKKETKEPMVIDLPKLLINAFFVNHETLYIYDKNFLYKYQLKIE